MVHTKKAESKRTFRLLIIQVILGCALTLFVAFAYINSLWSQDYLHNVQKFWEKGPITDIILKSQSDSKSNFDTNPCPDDYELATQSKFAGYVAGCDCSKSDDGDYEGLIVGSCDSNQTFAGCRDIDSQDPLAIQIFNGKNICIQRDNDLSFYNLHRPLISLNAESQKHEAKCDSGYKLCGSDDQNHEYRLCVLEDKQCPLSNIKFEIDAESSESKLVKEDKTTQLPIISLQMSEYGPPCIVEDETNVTPDKKEHDLMRPEFYEGCETAIENQYTQPGYKKVDGQQQISEYNIFSENNDILDKLKALLYYDVGQHKNYYYNLYQMSYPHWSYSCHSKDDRFPITPNDIKIVIANAKTVREYAVTLLSIGIIITISYLLNMLILWLNMIQTCRKQNTRNCSLFRYFFTLIASLMAGGLLYYMIEDSDMRTSDYLSKNDCSNDEILNNSFKTMHVYFKSLNKKHYVTIIIILLMIALDLAIKIINFYYAYQKKKNLKTQQLQENLLDKNDEDNENSKTTPGNNMS
ncbi:UNKNOWN [Stylonychia lemnae]|uniref:Transmembrane protein n=1 Tax=Stylonychia lemnae TaxID=5949 RepID=A0A078AVG0_STYLE|nr:UNKNOWN [Stylonychia lemnae]|eukprot:CDW86169.1 UNKNOWN [Stylonychia lemnae]